MTGLGKRILELRKRKNLSQTDLTNMAGISYTQIGRYKTNTLIHQQMYSNGQRDSLTQLRSGQCAEYERGQKA
jgi:transcriptional regulator with XRE-family HTH domain